jgi:hypothetical protein
LLLKSGKVLKDFIPGAFPGIIRPSMPAEVAGTSNLDPSTTSYLHFARGLKIRWSKKNKRTMVFFCRVPPMLP